MSGGGVKFTGTYRSELDNVERILCGVLVEKPEESMDRCTFGRDKSEILLETALNAMKPINHLY